jgi:acyl carrier protein
MHEFVEPRVRRVVAEYLGVEAEDLTPSVSLIDELAADSLDLVELAIALEADFGIVLPESAIDDLRTYGDLVDTVKALTRERREIEAVPPEPPRLVWARVLPPDGASTGSQLQRVGWLTPYSAETIAEDALSMGRGARLEVTVPPSVDDASIAQLQHQFAWLGDRGVQVSVRRDHHLGPRRQAAHPIAAA